MTLNELREACQGHDYVMLHLPPPNGSGYTRRLCGSRGPRGEIINGRRGEGQTVRFESVAVLRFVNRAEKEMIHEAAVKARSKTMEV